MNLRTFYTNYGLELIPVAMENLTLTKCVWDGGWFNKTSFTHKNMPNYILNAFVQKNLMASAESDTLLNSFRNQPKVDAAFAQTNIELDIEDAIEIDLKGQLDTKSTFNLKKVKSFTISNSKGISIPNSVRLSIDQMLDQIKDEHWNDYKTGLRRAYMITELYYGTLTIAIDSDLEADFEASLPNIDTTIANKLVLGRTIAYSFESLNVPFAMRLERIKHFNS